MITGIIIGVAGAIIGGLIVAVWDRKRVKTERDSRVCTAKEFIQIAMQREMFRNAHAVAMRKLRELTNSRSNIEALLK